ncbi:MAG: glycosyl transferase, partial [Chitinophagaceae bacterium]
MNLAFTICTASYLPFAKALGDSLVQHNPDYAFKIVLLDDFKANEKFFQPHEIIPVADM